MGEEIIKKFIINMYARKIPIEEIATTVNRTKENVRRVIEESKKEVSQTQIKLRNEENILSAKNTKINKDIEKEDKKTEEQIESKSLDLLKVNSSSNKIVIKLLQIKRKIMLGEKYNKKLLKEIEKRIIRRSYSNSNIDEVEALAQIYVQLGRFENAKAFVKEIYDAKMGESDLNRIISRIEKQELSYRIMKCYKEGLDAAQIAERVGIYTINAIREINKQKELNSEIKRMNQKGKSAADIAELFYENIDRVKWGIELEERPKKELNESR